LTARLFNLRHHDRYPIKNASRTSVHSMSGFLSYCSRERFNNSSFRLIFESISVHSLGTVTILFLSLADPLHAVRRYTPPPPLFILYYLCYSSEAVRFFVWNHDKTLRGRWNSGISVIIPLHSRSERHNIITAGGGGNGVVYRRTAPHVQCERPLREPQTRREDGRLALWGDDSHTNATKR